MRVLILSCNTGGGHNSAAKALAECFDRHNWKSDILNTLDFLPQITSNVISHGHDFAYRHLPKLYGVGYRYEENHPPVLFYEQNKRGSDVLFEKLRSGKYDAVVCVHIFSCMMMTELKKSGRLDIPFFFVATDYTCSPGVSELQADAFFIPHEKLTDEFISNGIPHKNIYASGIPVAEEFLTKSDKKRAKKELGYSEENHIVLLSSGSMGCGPIKSIADKIISEVFEDCRLIIVCGKNKRLLNDLRSMKNDSRIKIMGYTHQMNLLMDAADIIVTKAGGLSTTEAVMKRLPIIYINAVPGCEGRNIEFMTKNGYAAASSSEISIAEMVKYSLSGALDCESMVKNREKDFTFTASKNIYNYISKYMLIKSRETEINPL